jgi:endonuclease/exonuclease/phosphatase family metal-dependent hydrolase
MSRLALAAGAAIAGLVSFSLAVRGLWWFPAPIEPVAVFCPANAPAFPGDRPLRVLVWNIQFGSPNKHHFFYDGGEQVYVPAADVASMMDEVAAVVRGLDPDVILWQEVDRGSDRTGRLDQLAALHQRLDYPCAASTPYHRVPYVPTPDHAHLGRVEMHLAISSRYRLENAARHQLALLNEPWWRQIFNLRRAVLAAELPVEQGTSLVLLNTHLSAFSNGDGTLPRQVEQVRTLALSARDAGHPVLLAGDLNALPPGDDVTRLPEKDRIYFSDVSPPLEPLYRDLTPSVPLDRVLADPVPHYTYLPWGGAPDRTIDHAFFAGPMRVLEHRVDQTRLDLSDHLPFLLSLEVSRP